MEFLISFLVSLVVVVGILVVVFKIRYPWAHVVMKMQWMILGFSMLVVGLALVGQRKNVSLLEINVGGT